MRRAPTQMPARGSVARRRAQPGGWRGTHTKIVQGWPKLWANFMALIGIFSQSVGPSLAIWANPVQFSFHLTEVAPLEGQAAAEPAAGPQRPRPRRRLRIPVEREYVHAGARGEQRAGVPAWAVAPGQRPGQRPSLVLRRPSSGSLLRLCLRKRMAQFAGESGVKRSGAKYCKAQIGANPTYYSRAPRGAPPPKVASRISTRPAASRGGGSSSARLSPSRTGT
jgi:hypothetical protein